MIDYLNYISENYQANLGVYALILLAFLIEMFIVSGKWKEESSLFLSILNYSICILLYTIDMQVLAITVGVVGYFIISIYAIFLRKKLFKRGVL